MSCSQEISSCMLSSPFCHLCPEHEKSIEDLPIATARLDQKTIKKANTVGQKMFNLLAMYFFFSVGTFALWQLKKT